MSDQPFVVLRDLSRRHGGLGFGEQDTPGTPSFTADAEPHVERIELNPGDAEQLSQDPSVVGLAPVVPVRLIGPVGVVAEGQTEQGDDSDRIMQLIQPVAAGERPDDNSASASWGLVATGVTSCHHLSGAGVVVAVIDSGIADKDHPAFRGVTIDDSKNFSSEIGDPLGHGTHCAGTIFGQDVDGVRIGVARGIEKALIVKVFDRSGSTSLDTVLEAIEWSHNQGAHLISLSLAIDIPGLIRMDVKDGRLLEEAVSYWFGYQRDWLRLFENLASMYRVTRVKGPGSLLVAAAGNESRRPERIVACGLPAQALGFISVGAVRSEGPPHKRLRVAEFSNRGPEVCAPGVGIVSAGPGKGLTAMSGTSMAAPHVAGIAALCWEALAKVKAATPKRVAEMLIGTASRSGLAPGPDFRDFGMGVVVAPEW
jgi:subtilisin family serine protease